MILLYADENFPFPVVEELRVLGCDVLTLQGDGRGNQRFPDNEVLARASELGRTLLTTNRRHFVRLHLESNTHSGIVVCTYDPDAHNQARRINDGIQSAGPLSGKLLRINRLQG